MLKRFLKRWSFLGLLVIVLGVAGGCVSDEIADNADFILEEMSKTSAPAGPIMLEEKTLVYASDLPDLVGSVRSVQLESDKKDLVKDYLTQKERIDCILDDVEEAAADNMPIRCQGKILVDRKGEHGLLGISEMLEEVNSRDGDVTRRDYMVGYLRFWDEIQRIDRVNESLGQIKRTKSIPLLGTLMNNIHRFSILYEGHELVPWKDIPSLLEKYDALNTDESRRAMVTQYLER